MVTRSQTKTTTRKKPGSTGKGDYYHVEVRPKAGFVTFRTQDVGKRGHIQRVAGKKSTGTWETVKWLIGKEDAHVRGDKLVPDTKGAKDLIKELGAQPVHVSGDRFKARSNAKAGGRAKSASAKAGASRKSTRKTPTTRSRK
jgi:hypothetical protein